MFLDPGQILIPLSEKRACCQTTDWLTSEVTVLLGKGQECQECFTLPGQPVSCCDINPESSGLLGVRGFPEAFLVLALKAENPS